MMQQIKSNCRLFFLTTLLILLATAMAGILGFHNKYKGLAVYYDPTDQVGTYGQHLEKDDVTVSLSPVLLLISLKYIKYYGKKAIIKNTSGSVSLIATVANMGLAYDSKNNTELTPAAYEQLDGDFSNNKNRISVVWSFTS
ncbi:hypothetical protein BDA99DRAFT_40008 [Phascolomyces articulosus]|uniref:Uncharacterized protein n=1 Tax=Phascolomyces articulosus TaxID=60185 RepID=A0AAD5PGH2_9FUNG|nr:hypothetical protein BDA99DRAFT_40008 [Phascolomyces articulosus]